jgi:hypothetical protein
MDVGLLGFREAADKKSKIMMTRLWKALMELSWEIEKTSSEVKANDEESGETSQETTTRVSRRSKRIKK